MERYRKSSNSTSASQWRTSYLVYLRILCEVNKREIWFSLSRSALMFECLLFGLKNRGLLILLLPDALPASVVGIFRRLDSWVFARKVNIQISVPTVKT